MKHPQALLLTVSALFATSPLYAAGSGQHSAAASAHAAASATHGVVGSAKLGAAITSIPLQAVGALGQASGQAGAALADWSEGDTGPLPISDQPLAAGPAPDQMLQQQ